MRAAERPDLPLLRLLLSLGLDYLRWTQLVPMVTAWAFLLVMIAAMLLVNFQQQSFDLIASGAGVYERVFGPIDAPDGPGAAPSPEAGDEPAAATSGPGPRAVADPDGSVRFTGEDLEGWVLRLWGGAAFAGWLLGLAWRRLFGAPPLPSLKRKLLWTGAAGAGVTLLFLFAYFFGSETFHGGFAGWLALFVGAPLVVWCISAWSLAISAAITRVQEWIETADARRVRDR